MRSFSIAAAAATLAGFAVAADNSTSSGNSVELFIDDALGGQGLYAASIVNACKDHAVYAIQCTSARNDIVGDPICGDSAPTLTLTEGPSLYSVAYSSATSTLGHKAEVSVGESCNINIESREAFCVATVSVSLDGTSTVTSTSTSVTGSDFHRYRVPITAGAQKTASATGACTAGGDGDDANAAAGTGANVVRAIGAALAVGLAGVIAL
ncbi:hypothetical protein L209DRAFT_338599 [Thermothelomyces heterothallicus CBS 203.75]